MKNRFVLMFFLIILIGLPKESYSQNQSQNIQKFHWPFGFFLLKRNEKKSPPIYSSFGEFRSSNSSPASPILIHEATDIDPSPYGRIVFSSSTGFITRHTTSIPPNITNPDDRLAYAGSRGSGPIKIGHFGYNHIRPNVFDWFSFIKSESRLGNDSPRAVLVVDGITKIYRVKVVNSQKNRGRYGYKFSSSEVTLWKEHDFRKVPKFYRVAKIGRKEYITVAEILPGRWVWTVYWPKFKAVLQANGPIDMHLSYHSDKSPRSRYLSINDLENPLLYLPYKNTKRNPIIGSIFIY